MKKYPIRDENQDLEEISRRYFEQCLPSNWPAFKPPNDYGIDLYVDIFHENFATGLELLIQLKSSKHKSENKYESTSLKISTFNYLKEKLQVVMIVKYNSDENEAYWLLLNEIPYPNQNQKTFTVKIPKSNSLSNIDWNLIQKYISKVSDKKLSKKIALEQQNRYSNNNIIRKIQTNDFELKDVVDEKIKLIKLKKAREIFNSSYEGTHRTEQEVELLFKIFINNINEISDSDTGLLFKCEQKQDGYSKILEISSHNLILRIDWFSRITNSLSKSGLGLWLTEGFRHFDDYGEQGNVINKAFYFANIDYENTFGWSLSRDSDKILSSKDIVEDWLGRLIENIKI